MEQHEGGLEARGRAALADETSAQSKRRPRPPGPHRRRPRFDVVGFGALNLDHLYAVPQLIQDGGVEVLTSTAQPGGSAANTIYGLAKLGLRCGFVGVVGDDHAGEAILESFEEVGVDTSSILVRPGAKSGQTICITAGQGQKAIYIIPGANSLLESCDINLTYLSDTRYVHLSSFVGERPFSQQLEVVSRLPARVRVCLSLDTVYARQGLKAIGGLLGRCALLFANADELRQLTGQELPDAAHTCLDVGCEAVVVTFGSGAQQNHRRSLLGDEEITASMIVTRRGRGRSRWPIEHTVPAVRTHRDEVVDTIGAGDAFAAGFLFGLLSRRYGLAKCGGLGHTAAEFSLTKLGARPGLPTRQDLLTRFDESFRSFFGGEGRSRPVLNSMQAG
jgi:ribokinase